MGLKKLNTEPMGEWLTNIDLDCITVYSTIIIDGNEAVKILEMIHTNNARASIMSPVYMAMVTQARERRSRTN